MNAQELMNEISKEMSKKDQRFSYYLGLRGMYNDEGLGEMKNSFVWDDGEQTDEQLNGTCAIVIGVWWDGPEFEISELEKAIETAKSYGDGRYGVLVGDNFVGGEDIDEVVISGAECVYVF